MCLKNSENLFYMYEYKNKRLISEMILEIIPELTEIINEYDDQKSYFVCSSCYDIIVKSCELRRLSIENNRNQKSIESKPVIPNIKVEKTDSEEDYSYEFTQNVSAVIETDNEEQPAYDNEIKTRRSRKARRTVQLKQELSDDSSTNGFRSSLDGSISRKSIKREKSCIYCRKSFTSNHLLKYHYDFEHEDKKLLFSCKMCSTKGLDEDDFKIHSLNEHQIELDAESIVEYVARVRERSNFQCDICLEKFNTKSRIEHHLVYKHLKSPDVKNKSCSVCNISFSNEHSVLKHYDQIHKNLKRTYSCNKCSEDYTNEYRLRRHKKEAHGVMPKVCTVCNAEFSTKREFNLHSYLHCDYLAENQDPVKFECILCSFYTFDQNELYNHLPYHTKDFEQNERLIVCINCNTVVRNFECLHSHTGDHNEYLTHECLKCNKKFAMGTKLLKHLMRHDESSLLRCPHAGCSFSTLEKYSLDIHVKHRHENVVLHLCQICGASFSERASLKSKFQEVLKIIV